eukprot:scaffold4802_cov112-Isochrysis_galbana.AAC.4
MYPLDCTLCPSRTPHRSAAARARRGSSKRQAQTCATAAAAASTAPTSSHMSRATGVDCHYNKQSYASLTGHGPSTILREKCKSETYALRKTKTGGKKWPE